MEDLHRGGIKGGGEHLSPLPSEALSPTPPPPSVRSKNGKISHFWQSSGFLPPQKCILLPQCPPTQKFCCRHWIYSGFSTGCVVWFSNGLASYAKLFGRLHTLCTAYFFVRPKSTTDRNSCRSFNRKFVLCCLCRNCMWKLEVSSWIIHLDLTLPLSFKAYAAFHRDVAHRSLFKGFSCLANFDICSEFWPNTDCVNIYNTCLRGVHRPALGTLVGSRGKALVGVEEAEPPEALGF